MSLTLSRRARALLLFLSAAGYTAWFSGLGERTDAAGVDSSYPASASTPHFESEPNIATVIARDPFAGGPVHAAAKVADTATPAAADDTSPQRIAGSASGVVVPNIGDAPNVGANPSAAEAAPLALIVRATIVGRNPVAYVENGTMMDIVRVGDTLGDQRVAKIDLGGLTFADGSRLDLPPSAGATPAPAKKSGSVAQSLDEIRKLLMHLHADQPAAEAHAAPVPAEPQATAVTTPEPLQTADSRGIPVGTNPTPDANGPTAFPYPYPYPAAR